MADALTEADARQNATLQADGAARAAAAAAFRAALERSEASTNRSLAAVASRVAAAAGDFKAVEATLVDVATAVESEAAARRGTFDGDARRSNFRRDASSARVDNSTAPPRRASRGRFHS